MAGKRFVFLFLATILTCVQLRGQDLVNPDLKASFIQAEIELDGVLNEEVWITAQRISSFTQRELKFGEPVTERTEVAIAYTKDFLYVGVWCYDSNPQNIIAKEMKRDFKYDLDDNFILIFDTYHDKRNGFMFVTNPNGARADLQVYSNGGASSQSWNGVWDVRTKVTHEGWFAEFRIPFYTLKYRTDSDKHVWGVNFERNIRRKREQSRWKGYSRDNKIEQVNKAGTLGGLDSLQRKKFVEVKPYAIAGGERTANGDKGVANVGGDINYLITPTYRINATFNTDFAQVESDRQQVNITRFPLFFPELREFFLEGNNFFDMGFGGNRITPFYTRRIGLDENREAVPIIAGARLLGKEHNHTLGLMSILTAETESQAATQYATGSWRQDVGKQSVIGIMTTNKISEGRWHSTTGINGRYSTSTFRSDKNLDMSGAFIQTYNNDTSFVKKAYAYRFFVMYPNDKFTFIASSQRSPINFNPEVGLMRRTNFSEQFTKLVLTPRPKKNLKWIRQYDFSPFTLTYVQHDDTKELQTFEYGLRYLGFETRSGENISLDYVHNGEGLQQDFEISEGVTIPANTYWWSNWRGNFSTFEGRTIWMSTDWVWGKFYEGRSLSQQTEVVWRMNKYANLNVRYELYDVDLPQGSFNTHLFGSRFEYAVNPRVFGSLLSQWNTSDDVLNINFRLQVIPKIGTDFYLIINQIYDTKSSLNHTRTTILGKLIWRFIS